MSRMVLIGVKGKGSISLMQKAVQLNEAIGILTSRK